MINGTRVLVVILHCKIPTLINLVISLVYELKLLKSMLICAILFLKWAYIGEVVCWDDFFPLLLLYYSWYTESEGLQDIPFPVSSHQCPEAHYVGIPVLPQISGSENVEWRLFLM